MNQYDRDYAYAAFDTETSGLFRKDAPDTADGQARLASLSIVKVSPFFATQSEETIYIKPAERVDGGVIIKGWKNADGSMMRAMPAEAQAVHGLSMDFLMEHGHPITTALDMWVACVEEGRVMCSHGVKFDVRVMRAELERLGRPSYEDKLLTICTMMKTIGICKLRQENGAMKTPKLSEALAHFKLPQQGAHTSIGDTIGVVSLLRMLKNIGFNLTPEPIPVRPWSPPKEKGVAKQTRDVAAKKAKPAGQSQNWLLPDKTD